MYNDVIWPHPIRPETQPGFISDSLGTDKS